MVFEAFFQALGGTPSFQIFELSDWNPLSRRRKLRKISNPNRPMSILHKRFVGYLRGLKIKELLRFATGSRVGTSAVRNVKMHSQNRFFYILDIKDAFRSVNLDRLADILIKLDSNLDFQKREEVREFLEKYFFAEYGGLNLGGPASNDLFNIYAGSVLDDLLRVFLGNLPIEVCYTRYVDDLTFSSKELITKKIRRAIREIVVRQTGFELSVSKSQFRDLEKKPIFINGVGIKPDHSLFLPRHYLRKIRGAMHRAMTKGDVSTSVIHGMMGVFYSVNNKDYFSMTAS